MSFCRHTSETSLQAASSNLQIGICHYFLKQRYNNLLGMKPSVNDFLDQAWIKDFFLDKEQIIANTELAVQLFSGLGYTHSKLLAVLLSPSQRGS